jgi:aryl-alcohol dehydrogenase-like predicted oxidoreductase
MIASLATRYSRAEVEASLREAREAGITFFDTADVYGQGDSERLLGKLFRSAGEGMMFCTKAGLTVGSMEPVVRLIKPVANSILRRWRSARVATTQARRRQERQCFDPDYLSGRIEGSLRRLKVDRIDLFLLHNPPVDVPQRDAVFERLTRFKAQGKLRWFGVSCRTLADASEWLGLPEVACIQIPIDRSQMEVAIPVLERARLHQVGVIAREVFAHDALAQGTVSDAFRPLVERSEMGVVLAGMSCRRHVQENVHAMDVATRCSHVA